MNKAKWPLVALALLLGNAACRNHSLGLSGSRHAYFRGSELMTSHREDRRTNTKVALLHVLFIPDREVPAAGGSGNSSSAGGTAEVLEMTFEYYEDTGYSVKAQPVIVERAETVKSGNKVFQLARGNLFIALVRADGTVDLSQIERVVKDENVDAESIVTMMKAAQPGNSRLRNLETTRAAA